MVYFAQSAVVNFENEIDINLGHEFLKIHLNNVLKLGPEIGRNVVSLAGLLGLDMIDNEDLVGEVDDGGEFRVVVEVGLGLAG